MDTSVVLKTCAAAYFVAALVVWLPSRNWRRLAGDLLVLGGLLALDMLVASAEAGYVTFGGGNSRPWVVSVMFVGILSGIVGHYIFYLKGQFSWLDCLRPLTISPFLLLALLHYLDTIHNLSNWQVLVFGLIAYQSGFFWQIFLQRAKPK